MMIIGLLRASGGIALLRGGAQSDPGFQIIASEGQLTGVGIGLLIAGILLIVAAVLFWREQTRTRWLFCWIALAVFLLNGLVNGFILFGHPLVRGQIINWGAALIIAILISLINPKGQPE
jgi:hypothetical protein